MCIQNSRLYALLNSPRMFPTCVNTHNLLMSAACDNELIPDITLIWCSLCFPEFMCINGYILLSCLTSHDWKCYFTSARDAHCLVSKLRSNHSCQICLHRNSVKLWAISLKPLGAPRRLDTGAIGVLEQTAILSSGEAVAVTGQRQRCGMFTAEVDCHNWMDDLSNSRVKVTHFISILLPEHTCMLRSVTY